jgi:hypothetical protein
MAVRDTERARSGGAARRAAPGRALLREPWLNHGTAFTAGGRAALGLGGCSRRGS